MERFFLNLKMERVWQKAYANHSEAMADVAAYIIGFYNCERLHSKLGNLSPNAFERESTSKNLSNCPKLLDHYISAVADEKPGNNHAMSVDAGGKFCRLFGQLVRSSGRLACTTPAPMPGRRSDLTCWLPKLPWNPLPSRCVMQCNPCGGQRRTNFH